MSQQLSLLPGQAVIRKHLETIEEKKAFATMIEGLYMDGVRDALHWVLNGGEPPLDGNVIHCRKCGCTQNDRRNCTKRVGWPCHWVEPDLCSACAEV